jgi:hypothetical protein
LTDKLKNEYATRTSAPIPQEIVRQIKPTNHPQDSIYRLNLSYDETAFYDIMQINGGYAVLTERLDEVIRLRRIADEQNDALKKRNNLLAHAREIQSEHARVLANQELTTILERTLRKKLDEINVIMNTISEQSDPVEGSTYSKFARIKLIVNYCKRRGNLAILETEGNLTDTPSLALWLKESLFEAETCGISGSVSENVNMPINTHCAALLYDYFQHILECCLFDASAMILASVSADEIAVKLRIVVETMQIPDMQRFEPEHDLQQTLKSANAMVQMDEEDDNLLFLISVPLESTIDHDNSVIGGDNA